MAAINEIGARLTAAGLTPVYLGRLPPEPHVAVAVYETGGTEPEYGFGAAGAKYERPGFQVVTRGEPEDYATPAAMAQTAYASLSAVEAQTLTASGSTSAFYHTVHPRQSPTPFDRDDQGRVYFSVNFDVEKEPSA